MTAKHLIQRDSTKRNVYDPLQDNPMAKIEEHDLQRDDPRHAMEAGNRFGGETLQGIVATYRRLSNKHLAAMFLQKVRQHLSPE